MGLNRLIVFIFFIPTLKQELWDSLFETVSMSLHKQATIIEISDRQILPGGKLGADKKGFKFLLIWQLNEN